MKVDGHQHNGRERAALIAGEALCPRLPRAWRGGFTLIEVVVAMAVLTFLMFSAYLTFDGMVRLRDAAEVTEETYHAGRVVLQRISRELSMSFLTRNPGSNQSYLTAFYGDDANPLDRLTFATFSHVRMYRESPEADTTEVSYFSEPDPDSPGLFRLLHREAPRIDGKPEEGGVVEVLARRVQYFNLRYLDNVAQEWKDSWDTTTPEHPFTLPRAVEVTFILVDLEGIEHFYATTVPLPTHFMKGANVAMPLRSEGGSE